MPEEGLNVCLGILSTGVFLKESQRKANLSVSLLCSLSPGVLRGAPEEDLFVIIYVVLSLAW